MPNAIRIHEYGVPDVLRWESVDVGEPAKDQVRIRHRAIGLNFIDVYERTGLYPIPLPAILGKEAAGVVEAVGAGVKHLGVGDRVAYAGQGSGAYSEVRVMPAERVLRLPDDIDDQRAAAMMLKGLTAQALLRQTYRVKRKDTLLVHSAAGGVGSMLVQWARHLGATVIGMVGSEAKAAKAQELGANHVLITTGDWVADVRALTRGRGVDVVYDAVGRETFMQCLDCLRPRGLMVSYGNSSGPAPAIAPLELSKRGSLYLTRPTLFHYIATRAALTRAAQELFGVVSRSIVNVQIGQTYPLQDAARAHADLEGRRTIGSTVLLPA
jgi:NADPH2:quinone reductase